MKISAVLFDVDGVLLDSAGAHRRVWNSWSLKRGLDPEKVWELTFGRRPEDTVEDAAAHLDPAVERKVLDELLAQEKDTVAPVEGAAALLEALSGSPWAIVTSGDRAFVEARFAAERLPCRLFRSTAAMWNTRSPRQIALPWLHPASASRRRSVWSSRMHPRAFELRWQLAASSSA